MKNLYAFVGLLLVCCGIISSCKTLFDVAPKGIYSPIELNKQTMVSYTKDSVLIVNEKRELKPSVVENSTVSLTVKEESLYYGAVLFYDSLNAIELIKTNRFIGVHELYFQDQKKGSSGLNRTVKVRIDPSKGQAQYIVPVAYNTSDSSVIYNAQGLIRTTISPWSHFTDIIPPAINERVTLIRGNDTLNYIKSTANAFSCYRYNFKTAGFDAVGTAPPLSTTIAYGANVNTQSITPTDWIFYRKGTYYIVGIGSESKSTPVTSPYFAGRFGQTYLSVMTFDKNFKYKGFSNGFDLTTNGFSSGGDILDANFNLDTLRIFYNTLTYSAANRSGIATYTGMENSFLQDYQQLSEKFLNPSLALTVGNKFIINNSSDQTSLRIFTLFKGNISKPILAKVTDINFFSFINTGPIFKLGFFCLSADTQGYVIGKNQIIYKVEAQGSFQPIYTKWFPANGPASIIQGIMYKDKLAFLLNNYEVWLFNPNEITIDFNRPGAVKIIPL